MAVQFEYSNATRDLTADDLSYVAVTISVSTLSFIGCMLIVVTYAIYKDIRTTSRKFLVYLSLADMLTAIGNVVGVAGFMYRSQYPVEYGEEYSYHNTWLCIFPAGLTIFSSISSFSWTVCIAIYLYLSIARNRLMLAEKLTLIFHLVSWMVPGVVLSCAAGREVLGSGKANTTSWCWIKHDHNMTMPYSENLAWTLLTGPAWNLLAILLSSILYMLVKCHIRKEIRREGYISRETLTAIQQANAKLTFVPLVFILVRIWGIIRFLVNFHMQTGLFLELMQGIGDSAQGFANAILFCFCTTKIRKHLIASVKSIDIKKYFECCLIGQHNGMKEVGSTYYQGRIRRHKEESASINTKSSNETSPLLSKQQLIHNEPATI